MYGVALALAPLSVVVVWEDVDNTVLVEDAPRLETVEEEPVSVDGSTLVESPVETDAESVDDPESVALAETLLTEAVAESVLVLEVDGVLLAPAMLDNGVVWEDVDKAVLVEEDVPTLETVEGDPVDVDESVLVVLEAESVDEPESVALAERLLLLEAVAESVLVLEADVCDVDDGDAESVAIPVTVLIEAVAVAVSVLVLTVGTCESEEDTESVLLSVAVCETTEEDVDTSRLVRDEVLRLDRVDVDSDAVEDSVLVGSPVKLEAVAESVFVLSVEVCETVELWEDVDTSLLTEEDVLKDRVSEAVVERVLVDCPIEIVADVDSIEDTESVALTEPVLLETVAESVLLLRVKVCEAVLLLKVEVCDDEEDAESVLAPRETADVDATLLVKDEVLKLDKVPEAVTESVLVNCPSVVELSVNVCETVEDCEPVRLSVDVCDDAEDEETVSLLSVDVCVIVADEVLVLALKVEVCDTEEEAVLGRSLAPHTPLLMAGPTLDLR
ncbi:hypothetical protein LTR27_002584 [Elasticomyces elasticus]|nr:hypothetical protein LTR27_002584 [Elasticomyces elasticus]